MHAAANAPFNWRKKFLAGLGCIARDATEFWWKDNRRHSSSKESLQVKVHEEASVVNVDDRMEGFDPADVDVVQDAGRDEDIVQSFGASAVRV